MPQYQNAILSVPRASGEYRDNLYRRTANEVSINRLQIEADNTCIVPMELRNRP